MDLDSSGPPPPVWSAECRMGCFTCSYRHRSAGFRWQKQITRRASQKCTKKERQMGKAGMARGQLEEKAAWGSSSGLTWGNVSGRSLLLCVPSSVGGVSPMVVVRAWSVSIIILSRAGSVGLHFYAFLSEYSQGNSSWWAQKCQSESWPSLGPWRFLQKVKKVSGPVSPLGFPSPASHLFHLLLPFQFFFFQFHLSS